MAEEAIRQADPPCFTDFTRYFSFAVVLLARELVKIAQLHLVSNKAPNAWLPHIVAGVVVILLVLVSQTHYQAKVQKLA